MGGCQLSFAWLSDTFRRIVLLWDESSFCETGRLFVRQVVFWWDDPWQIVCIGHDWASDITPDTKYQISMVRKIDSVICCALLCYLGIEWWAREGKSRKGQSSQSSEDTKGEPWCKHFLLYMCIIPENYELKNLSCSLAFKSLTQTRVSGWHEIKEQITWPIHR